MLDVCELAVIPTHGQLRMVLAASPHQIWSLWRWKKAINQLSGNKKFMDRKISLRTCALKQAQKRISVVTETLF